MFKINGIDFTSSQNCRGKIKELRQFCRGQLERLRSLELQSQQLDESWIVYWRHEIKFLKFLMWNHYRDLRNVCQHCRFAGVHEGRLVGAGVLFFQLLKRRISDMFERLEADKRQVKFTNELKKRRDQQP